MTIAPRRSSRRLVIAGGASVMASMALLKTSPGLLAQTDRGLLDLLYALEQLQVALYEAILEGFDDADFAAEGIAEPARSSIQSILEAERAHLALLQRPDTLPESQGVAAAPTSLGQALQEAVVLENFVTAAYAGVIPLLDRERLIADVIGIHSVEARHAAWLSTLIGGDPYPDAIDVALSPEVVVARLERISQDGSATPTVAGGAPATVLDAIAAELGVAPEAIQVTRAEAVEWPDTSLGCPRPGEVYAQVITPGFLLVIDVEGDAVEFHSDERGNVVRCP